MSFKIQSGIPLPPAGGRGPRTEYPFASMEIGDSFFVPNTNVKKMSGQVSYWKKDPHNMNFALRAVIEEIVNDDGELEEVEGVRVWKISPDQKGRRGRKPAALKAAEAEAEANGDVESTEAPKKSSKKSKKVEAEAESEY